MSELINWVTANWDSVLGIVTAIVTVASLVVKLTPTPKDDAVLAKILAVFKLLALNKEKKLP